MGDQAQQVSHSVSGETIIEAVVNGVLGTSNAGHNSHTVTVQDSSGNTSTGHGNSESEARGNAERGLG